MKKIKKALALVLALAMVVTAFPITNAEAATTAKLSAKNATINVGGKKVLTLTTPSTWKNVKTSWKVGKKSVAKIVTTTKKCSVRAQGVGSTNVKVKVTYAKSTKKGAKRYSKSLLCLVNVVDPTPEEPETPAVADGITATISNPISADYPNTVLVSDNAIITATVAADGKPVAGQTVILTTKDYTNSTYGANYEIKGNNSAVTDANGEARFVIGYKSALKSYYTDYVCSVN